MNNFYCAKYAQLCQFYPIYGFRSNFDRLGFATSLIRAFAFQWSNELVDLSEVTDKYEKQIRAKFPSSQLTSSQVREHLLIDSFDSLKAAGDWEQAIEFCDQLIDYYKYVKIDFERLADILVSDRVFKFCILALKPIQTCRQCYPGKSVVCFLEART